MNISGSTMLVGVIGWPVGHTKSPAMHNAAAADLGLDLLYLPLAVQPDNLEKAVSGLVALGFRGVNVTVPHKEAVMALLDEIDPAALAIGAVNTIVVSGQGSVAKPIPQPSLSDPRPPTTDLRLIGYNTDSMGFMADLAEQKLKPQLGKCMILGAGGSARAVAYGLASAGNQVHIIARRLQLAQNLVEDLVPHCQRGELTAHSWQALVENDELLTGARLIVNCTPVGMAPNIDQSPWPIDRAFPTSAFVYDLVYRPAETKLLQRAKSAGCRSANGLGMLVHQGALAFRLWTGKHPDLVIMSSAVT
jgi:shikimate dehydrogenase